MLEFMMPAALVIASNVIYQICAKGVPADIDPLASVTVTYLVGAALSPRSGGP